jgi:hypothetical protein
MDIKEIKWQVKWWLPTIWFRYFVRPIRRVKTVLAYMKQGWNTEDWDYVYILEDMVFKMKRLNNRIKLNDVLDEEYVAEIDRQIKEVTDLIDKDAKDEFYDHIPSVEVETIPVEGKPYFELKFLPPKGMTAEERHELFLKANEEYTKNWNKIFELLAKYMHNWWD